MAKARAILKRRKAVRNIRKITKTMQMISTVNFQKALKRAGATKPYTLKVRELVRELAQSVGNVEHPLLRDPSPESKKKKIALVVMVSNRGLAGAYNASVLRTANHYLREQDAAGESVDLYVSGKKGIAFFTFQRRPILSRLEGLSEEPRFADVEALANELTRRFVAGEVDAVRVCYMNFLSAGSQRPEVMTLLPLSGVDVVVDRNAGKPGAKAAAQVEPTEKTGVRTEYEFSPDARVLLDELLPLTVKTTLFQAFLDSVTSENVSRMIAMKSATDNADKMVKSLTMKYNRARQSQITTELAEIMGGVEAMNK